MRLARYSAVDDIGTVVNPMIVEGQLHGGVAQGAGQALGERCMYDAGGQLLSASFQDYALPRADELPAFVSENDESQPCTHNPLGAKGCGEAGTIPAPAAIVNEFWMRSRRSAWTRSRCLRRRTACGRRSCGRGGSRRRPGRLLGRRMPALAGTGCHNYS